MSHPLYPPVVVEHDRAPLHAATVQNATHELVGDNPLCGDRVSVSVRAPSETIEALGCVARGCALCRASGSLMTQALQARAIADSLELSRLWIACVSSDDPGDDLVEDLGCLRPLLTVRKYPSRVGCVTLPWETLVKALTGESVEPER